MAYKKDMLRWFGHVERMDERRLTKEIYKRKARSRAPETGELV
jgi:hypothetical protein